MKNGITNAEWMIKNGHNLTELSITPNGGVSSELVLYKIFFNNKVIDTIATKDLTTVEAMLSWLNQKYDPKILNNAEKQYLAAVIRPFRDDVLYIEKYNGRFRKVGEFEKVIVDYKYKPLNETFCFDLPPFEKGAMYKGMKAGQKYTLEDLGL